MTLQPTKEDIAVESVYAVEQHGGKSQAARALGITRNAIRYRLAQAYSRYGMQPHSPRVPVPEGQRIGKNTIAVDAAGRVGTQWARLSPTQECLEAWVDGMIDAVDGKAKRIPRPKRKTVSVDVAQVIIGDPHAGMYAWAKETGSDYDLSIFKRVHYNAICNLIDRAGPVKEIIFTWLGDLMHSDHRNGTTQSGHILDMDGRIGAVMDAVQDVVNSAIAYAAGKARKVTVLLIPGNHDGVSNKWIQRLTAAYWRQTKHIYVPVFEENRYYLQRGSNMLMAHHGDKIQAPRLALLAAQEEPKMWAATQYRFCDSGHVHNSKRLAPAFDIDESPGLTVEYHRVMAGLEAYGAECGYSARRMMKCRLLSHKFGDLGMLHTTAEMLA